MGRISVLSDLVVSGRARSDASQLELGDGQCPSIAAVVTDARARDLTIVAEMKTTEAAIQLDGGEACRHRLNVYYDGLLSAAACVRTSLETQLGPNGCAT
jgi:hypothetical protein